MTAKASIAVALSLAYEWHVSPLEVLRMPVDLVMAGVRYKEFRNDYERKFVELNKDK